MRGIRHRCNKLKSCDYDKGIIMVKQSVQSTAFYFPHGLSILAKPTVIAAWFFALAVVIIPVNVIFELNKGINIFILILTAVAFAGLMISLKPKVYLTLGRGKISYNTSQFLWKNEISVNISNIERIKTISSTTTVAYVSISSEETGLILIDKLGDEFVIESSCFNGLTDYNTFKKKLLESPDLNLI